MIFRRCLITLCALIFGQSLAAQSIPIVSGEHEGFSRLVFEGRKVSGWSHEVDGGSHSIQFEGHTGGFRTEAIYRRIANTRLAQFEAGRTRFDFQLGCACEVEIFKIGTNVLVVDIKDMLDAEGNVVAAAAPLGAGVNHGQQTPLGFGKKLAQTRKLPRGIQPSALANVALAQDQVEPSQVVEPMQQEVEVAQVLDQPDPPEPEVLQRRIPLPEPELNATLANQSDILRAAQRRLLEEFGAASTRGVITPRMLEGAFGDGVVRPQVDVRIFDSSEAIIEQADASISSGNLRITSSTDVSLAQRTDGMVTTSGFQCIDPKRLDVNDWADDTSFDQQVGAARRMLFGEFDKIDPKAAVALARLYIHFGFGAEARAILVMDPKIAGKWPELLDIASVLEHGHAKRPKVMQHYADCESAAALWSLLAKDHIDADQAFDKRAALLALSSLPGHLRAFLAPELSKRFLDYGDQVAATDAMRSLERLTAPATDQAVMAQADLEWAHGDTEHAGALREEIVGSNSEYSAQALIALVEADLDAGRSIDRETADLVEAYATELRGAPIAAELRRIQVLALAKSAQFNAAYAALHKLEPTIEPDLANELRAKLLSHVTQDAEDVTFMDTVFSEMANFENIKNKIPLLDAAHRLQMLGFPEVAERVLEDGEVTTSRREAKILRALIALDLKRPGEAEAHIITLAGPEIDVLRARASELKGERIKAHALYSNAQQIPDAQTNAWLSDEWMTLTDPEAPMIGSLARIAAQDIDRSLETDGMLARSRELLSESEETRSVILDALRMDPS